MKTLNVSPNERGSLALTTSFLDTGGNPIYVTDLILNTWQLTDAHGNVINNRSFALSSIPADGVIILSGDDLDVADRVDPWRVITFKLSYTSTEYGVMPLTDEYGFTVNDLLNGNIDD